MLKVNKIVFINITLLLALVLGVFFYIFFLNSQPATSYELRLKEREWGLLKVKNQALKLQLAELNSLSRIESLALAEGMARLGEIAWLEKGQDVAIR